MQDAIVSKASSSARGVRHPALWVCLALLLATLAAYLGSLGNGPVWDDRALVLDNRNLRSLAGAWRILTADLWSATDQAESSSFYRPVAMLTFLVNTLVGGGGAASYRLGNVLLHAANAMLLAGVVRRLAKTSWAGAGLVALVWALSPACSEPVLWISGRFDLLVVTFALIALLSSRMAGKVGLAILLLSVACGLLSKESFIAVTPVLAFDDLVVRRRPLRELWPKYLAIAIISGVYLAARSLIEIPSAAVVTQTGVRAVAESFLFLVGLFVRVLAWPDRLDPFRPYASPPVWRLLLTGAGLCSACAAAAAFWSRAHVRDRGAVAAFGLFWFALATLPSAVVGPNLDMVGDRYVYLPSVGVFVALAAAVAEIEVARRRFAAGLGLLVSAICGAEGCVTARHAPDWRDDETLARSSLESSPENPNALSWLGRLAAQKGDLSTADALLARSMAGNRESWRTWNATCFVRLNQGRLPEAERACLEGLARNGRNPRGWVNLAATYARAGRWRESGKAAEQAVAVAPRYAEGRYLSALALANTGDLERARAELLRGLDLAPAHAGLRSLERQMQGRPP
jgi:protein O-mannosyl-transferase